MKPMLLATKTFLPSISPYQIPRLALEKRLDAAVLNHHRLILVSAPPGSGKSSLVSAWAAQQAVRLAWVSLESGDNDPVRFWSYFLAAIQPYYPEAAATMLEELNSPAAALSVLLPELINLLCSQPGSLVVVLDDYHLVEDSEIHQGVLYLLDHLPGQVCLAILTRVDPPLPVHRWRARGQLTEIRAADLRFTLTETDEFLNHQMGLSLKPAEIHTLEERTEGWATGLQLAALSMQGRDDVAAFIGQFSGSHHFVLEYLMNEVLALQSEAVQRFLLLTSILDTFCAPLCTAVFRAGAPESTCDAAALLAALEHANLFLIPLDDEHTWFRYHHLFAGFLSQRLKRQGEGELKALHQSAAGWYAQQQHARVDEALRHALAAGNSELAVEIVRKHAMPAASEGRTREVIGWIELLPYEALAADSQLMLLYAWMLVSIGKTNSLEQLIAQTGRLLETEGAAADEAKRQSDLGHIAALRAMQAARAGDLAATEQQVAEARRYATADNAPVLGLAWLAQANLLRERGDFEPAVAAYQQALRLFPATRMASGTYNLITAFGQTYLVQGQIQAAEALYRANLTQALEAGQGKAPAVGVLQCQLAGVAFEKNRVDEARTLFEQAEANSKRSGMVDLFIQVAILSARLSRADGDLPAALQRLEEAQELVRRTETPALSAEVSAWLARTRAEAGRLPDVDSWIQTVQPCPDHNPGYTHGIELFSLARVLICQGRLEEALALAGRLEKLAGGSRSVMRTLEAGLLQAEIFWAQELPLDSLRRLAGCFTLAEPAGFRRIFLDEGVRIAPVLAAWQASRDPILPWSRFADGLLRCFREEGRRLSLGETPPASAAIADLTARELDVLHGLVLGWSYAEIAGRLVISPGTVKTHASHIYAKLGVQGRLEAIRRARELGVG
jgi:LuxR family maltose regulon positive regulatory protein